MYGHLDEAVRAQADTTVAFPDAAVDRIVPIQHHEDPLAVTVEPFYEWVVDASAMFPGYKPVEGVHYVENLVPYIERKLFTVNTGHCAAAYIGDLQGYETIQQAMADESIVSEVKAALHETGAVLVGRYGFDQAEHNAYIAKIIGRFRNPHLTDEVTRVGRSPIRKLSPNDRLVRPALQAYETGIEPKQLARVMAAALRFDYPEDPESAELQQAIREQGVQRAVAQITSIPEDHPVNRLILANYEQMGAERS
ncbi:mannitol-1-phosphate 5-dehydrogenase [Paenibacillus sp. P26]|nr:mannitol-1-phosphate 5-dehydrogenase [Paenibacillus sp. P26]UUZ92025.1 mannitol-1-phosphate 5-dehydrogenase [Paenibacillus sp. P25]